MKKLSILLILLLLLAACGGTTPTASPTAEETAVTTDTQTDTDGLDIEIFFDGALAEEASIVDCTLLDRMKTTCSV